MLLAERLFADGEAGRHTHGSDTGVENPQRLEALREHHVHGVLLGLGQGIYDTRAGACAAAGEFHGDSLADGSDESALVGHHSVLEDDTADNDGYGRGQVANEAEGCGRGSYVAGLNEGLESDQWCLEIWSDAQASDDLEGEDAAPGAAAGKVNVETETDRHEDHAEPDRGKVLA